MKLKQILIEGKGDTIQGVHFSHHAGLKVLEAKRHGEGIPGAERKLKATYPETFINERVYFYVNDSKLRKEPGLGNIRYDIKLKNVYNIIIDKDKIKKEAISQTKNKEGLPENSPFYDKGLAATLMENIIKDRGYNGYYDPRMGIIIYFYDVKL